GEWAKRRRDQGWRAETPRRREWRSPDRCRIAGRLPSQSAGATALQSFCRGKESGCRGKRRVARNKGFEAAAARAVERHCGWLRKSSCASDVVLLSRRQHWHLSDQNACLDCSSRSHERSECAGRGEAARQTDSHGLNCVKIRVPLKFRTRSEAVADKPFLTDI